MHITAIYALGLVSFCNLLVALMVWLFRRFKRKLLKALTIVLCVLMLLGACYIMFFVILASPLTIVFATQDGTNRVAIMFTGAFRDRLQAHPMVSRWVFRRADSNTFLGEPAHFSRYGGYGVFQVFVYVGGERIMLERQ
ncbi:MAG: hypothetical protein FWB76_02290 [Oscillospiraceae bacterium]|nr:hypothetical protein [Oscillospiraceae bacterium]